MDWKSSLRRTQSLKSISPSCDKPTWTEAGLRDKKISVSQLVSRYQTTKTVSAASQGPSVNTGEVKLKQVVKEITASVGESKEIYLASLTKRSYEGERSEAKPSLTRSRSMGSLQHGAGSIEALKAQFESTQNHTAARARPAESPSPHKAAGITALTNGEAEQVKTSVEKQTTRNPPVNDTDAKVDHVTRKVGSQSSVVRRKTIGGIDFERIAASQADEKRRSVADFRDSSFFQSNDKLSVKVLSALYLSKVAPQEPKLAQDRSSESVKRVKITKFQPTCQEMCSACLKPVYPMEKINADKYIFHKTCFVCKQCKKKLSMYSYTPLHGEFYCIFHYQQLFRRKGNYDEGFGRVQHKDQWLLRNTADVVRDESEA